MSAAHAVRLAGNDVRAIAFDTTLRMASTIFSPEPSLAELYKGRTSRQEFVRNAHEVSVALTQQTAAQRRELAAAISAQLELTIEKISPDAERVEGAERLPGEAGYQRIIELLPGSARTVSLQTNLEKALVELWDDLTSAPFSDSMVIDFEGGDVTMTDNHIVGTLSFYGDPGEVILSDAQVGVLRSRFDAGRIHFLGLPGPRLLLSRNWFEGGVTAGGELIIRLRDLSLPDATLPAFVTAFSHIRATDNTMHYPLSLSGNHLPVASRIALVIARSYAFYLGNHGFRGEGAALLNGAPSSNAQTRDDLNEFFIEDAPLP
jgi:hypothetical protein